MQTFHHAEFADATRLVSVKAGQRISLCIPTFNEEATIGSVVGVLRGALLEAVPLLDELVVVDSGSTDRTRAVAAAAGATVVLASGVLAGEGAARGKGENVWKSLACTTGDLLAYVDGDVANMHPRFVLGTLGPLLVHPELEYVKAFYDRPHAVAEIGVRPAGGGRVTEALVRPLLSMFRPGLAALVQPLSGEYASRRRVLEALAMPTGYGVEVAHLLDVADACGVGAIAQTDLEERHHRHQDTASLGRMGFAILHAMLPRLAACGELGLPCALPRAYLHHQRIEGAIHPAAWELPDIERPPMRDVPAYRTGRPGASVRSETSGR